MISIFKNSYKLSLTLATFFILGMAASLFAIYSLPGSLHLTADINQQFLNVYLIIAITFLVGAIGLVLALRYKKEVVVFPRSCARSCCSKKTRSRTRQNYHKP